jgi:Beta-lactamase superfamily domain
LIAVHHGRLFSTVDEAFLTHQPTNNSTPKQDPTKSSIPLELEAIERIYPYIAFGFKIEEQVVYISDVSHIPDEAWSLLESESKVPVVVLDCLRLRPHTSHVGLEDSMKLARRIGAGRTYLTGFGHEVSHDEWVRLGEIVGGAAFDRAELTEGELEGIEMLGEERGLWVRPCFDGLRVCISSSGDVEDGVY